MKIKEFWQQYRYVLLGLIVVWLIIQNSGDTITILNRTADDICSVQFAYQPDEDGWGRNRLFGNPIRPQQSRDFRLPIYFEWFAPANAAGYAGRTLSCEGNVLEEIGQLGIDVNFLIWEIR